MEEETTDQWLARWLIAVAVFGSAVACWRGTENAFSTLKFTVIVVAAVCLVGLAGASAVLRRRLAVPRGPAMYALGAFVLLGAAAVLTSESTGLSLLGQDGRSSGFLLYLACAVLLLGSLWQAQRGRAHSILFAVVGGASLVAAYAILQHLGGDPITWGGVFGPEAPISTMGNVNFTSGYLGIALPLCAWLVLGGGVIRRLAGTASGVLVLSGLAVAGSSQGAVAGFAGVAVLLFGCVLEQAPNRRRVLGGALAGAVALGAVMVALGLAGAGPARELNDVGFDFRRHYWAASLSMVADHPVTGVGFDMWAGYFREARSVEAAIGNFSFVTDEPHSVPLGMFTSGGVALGAAYLAFVGLTAVALVRGLIILSGARRALLAAAGGAWVAYQVQSFVSIDMPALPVAHFVTAGIVLGVSGAAEWRGSPVRSRRRPASSRSRAITVSTIVAGLVLLGVWQASRPLRADYQMRLAGDAAGAGEAAQTHIFAATDLVDVPRPWIAASEDFARRNDFQRAYAAAREAQERDPRSFVATLTGARMAVNADINHLASAQYERALELEPNAFELVDEVARFYLGVGDFDRAEEVAERGTGRQPDNAAIWRLLGDIRAAAGRFEGARTAYERAAALDPATGAATALAGLPPE